MLPLVRENLCRRFSLAEIRLGTLNFDDELVIGKGGFGKVYRGTLKDDGSGELSIVAAIKRLDSRSKQGAAEFWAEVEMLSRLRHCHLVSLIGYCNDEDEMILVYELMPRGTLSDHLHKVGNRLLWLQRLRICIGAARGLDYLHTGSGSLHGVIHRDVKTSNILLDANWDAKISDFGLSKVGPKNQPSTYVNTAVKGTFGYVDPEYFSTGRLTRKSDVYAFGVVLLEVLCGRRAVDRSLDEAQWGLAGWAQDCIKEGRLEQIVDSSLSGQILLNCLKVFAQIAESCLRSRSEERPTMAEVVARLEFTLALQERPDFPGPLGIPPTKAPTFLQFQAKVDYTGLQSVPPTRAPTILQSQVMVDYSGPPIGKITFIRKILKFFFPWIVHDDGSRSRKNGENKEGASYNSVSSKHMVTMQGGDYIQVVQQQSGQFLTLKTKVFSFAELKQTTRNFNHDMLLGEGSFGMVFKGWVDKNTNAPSKVGFGIPVAIKKRRADSFWGITEWQTEVNFLGQISHPNLIRLLGYCMEDQEYLLVYEFMENGSLDQILFRNFKQKPFPWAMRLKIMIGAAQGLAFLHTLDKQVIHRNFKISSIMLDKDYNPKLSGFELVKSGPDRNGDHTHVSTRVMGTSGYADPEYCRTGHLTVKTDVYGFGVVLLEVLTGQRVLDGNRGNLVEWTRPYLSNRRKLYSIIDGRLEGVYPREGAFLAAMLALNCLNPVPRHRPSMKEVVHTLERINSI